ncbi:MAG: class I adenylate-forming enzyme family protein [Burkholderiaceae bacterium]|nr:class I adenylate-forming enzyme family protein [Burkholderiaceae bacterium]
MVREHARERPDTEVLRDDASALNWAELDALMDRIAASLQRDGLRPGDVLAICAAPSVRYGALYLGALRAGVVVAPLAPSVTPEQLVSMQGDAQARRFFIDAMAVPLLAASHAGSLVSLDGQAPGQAWDDWLAPQGRGPQPFTATPEHPFNIIYSSGTTGTPKGIVQSHGMRWSHLLRGLDHGYGPDSLAVISTPLYSNTTLVSFFPAVGWGGRVRILPKFDALRFLEIASSLRATHAMLVPVQYQRILAQPQFGAFDLSSFRAKFCTSAPFRADHKAEVLARWPAGALYEFYGMTEGGGSCILLAHEHPDKLHTVGRPAATSDIRLIDEAGQELAPGPDTVGEVVGHSPGMMTGYHHQPEKTREAEWFDATGKRFIRTGDVGRFDEDGFLILMDRRKDMIITGGFNVYPSDLEAELRKHPAVADVAVTGVPSEAWGETPVAFVCPQPGSTDTPEQIMAWYNGRAGKTQRLSALHFIDELPRSAIGKVLKRELRERHLQPSTLSA